VNDKARSALSADGEAADIVLGMLNAIEADDQTTQRKLARDLGIALGLANSYLKRCVKKGLVKINQVPANRYAYYLTPRGFAEKSRLTLEFLSQSFQLFRDSREEYSRLFSECADKGWTRLALCGTGELAEIAVLSASETEVAIVGVLDPNFASESFCGLPVFANMAEIGEFDAIVLTDLAAPHDTHDRLTAQYSAARILSPRLLGISPKPRVPGRETPQ
jgi:DNA-binding MarR family transcriptional regulator